MLHTRSGKKGRMQYLAQWNREKVANNPERRRSFRGPSGTAASMTTLVRQDRRGVTWP